MLCMDDIRQRNQVYDSWDGVVSRREWGRQNDAAADHSGGLGAGRGGGDTRKAPNARGLPHPGV